MRDFGSILGSQFWDSSVSHQDRSFSSVYHSVNYKEICIPTCGETAEGQLCDTSSVYQLQGMAMNNSIITQTKSLCRKPLGFPKYYKTVLDVSYMLGVFLGGKLYGIIADKYGRKKCMGVAIFSTFIGSGLGSLYHSVSESSLW